MALPLNSKPPIYDSSSYDAVPYLSNAFSFTHPLRLQTIGTLFGLNAPPAKKCRVLELGCASGLNLCAMASTLPESQFLGIDFSATQIAEGQEMISQLGLSNIELLKLDIAQFDERYGKFDYIVCHGLFSWVDAELQKKLLEICREQLTSEGVAYVSYNTLPGWYPRRMIREMLLYHANQFRNSNMFIEQARGMVTLLNLSLRNNNAPLSTFLKNSLKQIQEHPDWLLRHDVLEDINEPLYFHQFAEMLDGTGLQYLGDSDLPKMVDVGFPDEVRQTLRAIAGDIIRFEQYLDFLWNRVFRRSLICKNDAKLSRELAPRRLRTCFIASSLSEVEKPDDNGVTRFENSTSGFIETNDPIAIAVLRRLAKAWPQSVAFAELFKGAEQALKDQLSFTAETRSKAVEHLEQTLWNFAIRDLIEIQIAPWPFVAEVSLHPRASSLACWQAQSTNDIINQRHEVITLDAQSIAVLRLLDGTNTAEAILTALPSDSKMTLGDLKACLKALALQGLLEK